MSYAQMYGGTLRTPYSPPFSCFNDMRQKEQFLDRINSLITDNNNELR